MTNLTSKIEWTDTTWNVVTGCTKVSPGCDNCYAERFTERFHGKGSFTEVKLHHDRLDAPLRWRKPRRVFVNSMSDLFHSEVLDEVIARVWAVMAATPQHTYQVLTKRHGRMRSLLNSPAFRAEVEGRYGWIVDTDGMDLVPGPSWPLRNAWLGVSVEDQQRAELRIPALLETPAVVRFLSCEPLLGPVDLSQWLTYRCPRCLRRSPWTDGLSIAAGDHTDEFWCQTCGDEANLESCDPPDLSWVICGGESGQGARPMHPDWARSLRDQCVTAGVPFFFKQWGGQTPKAGGRDLDGREWSEFPQAAVTT